jgi:hypothetical protein
LTQSKLSKLIATITTIGCLFFFSINVYASTPEDNTIERSYNKALEQGAAPDDALYYAHAEAMMKNKVGNKNIDLSNVEILSDDYVKNNKWEFRERLINGDKAALKTTILKGLNFFEHAQDDVKKEINKLEKEHKKTNKITITYKDGSTVTYISGTDKVAKKNDSSVTTNDTYYNGPWNQATLIGQQVVSTTTDVNVTQNYTSWGEWQFNQTGFYGKVKGIMDWTYKSGPTTSYSDNSATRTAVNGDAFGTGIFSITMKTPGNSGITTATGFYNYITGWFAATVQMSATATLTFGNNFFVSGSVGSTGYWTYSQYTIVEVEGSGGVWEHAGAYK